MIWQEWFRDQFLSTPSARRATRSTSSLSGTSRFLSTPSARRATRLCGRGRNHGDISIHALREEGDLFYKDGEVSAEWISIHALREEGDVHFCPENVFLRFLSTPSARRATATGLPSLLRITDFYPRPPRGGRRQVDGTTGRLENFYPRPPRGGRLRSLREHLPQRQFLSTPSARRATAKTETKSLFSNKLYNILHEFRRALIYNGSKNYPNHAKRLKNPVRRCRKDAEDSPFAPGRKTQNNSRPSCSKGG